MDSEQVFWDRIVGMPALEAEQECLMRREKLVLENAMLQTERARIDPPIGPRQVNEFKDLGVAIQQNSALLSRLNEHIKYLRKLQDRINWKHAVKDLFGEEAMTQCVVYMEQKFSEVSEMRKQWAK